MQSVKEQIYPHWEVCIMDDGPARPHVRPILEEYAGRDTRFRVMGNPADSGTPGWVNKAISGSTGDYIVVLDSGELLEPDALAQAAWFITQHPGADLLYTDNDEIRIDDTPVSQFKPGFSWELLRSMHYFDHLIISRRKFLERTGFFKDYRCARDYELSDRAAGCDGTIAHIPLILCHGRETAGSTAASTETCRSESTRILKNSLARSKITWARVIPADHAKTKKPGIYTLIPRAGFNERISIIVTGRGGPKSILHCIHALFTHTRHTNREVFVILPENEVSQTRTALSARFPDTSFSYVTYPPSEGGNRALLKNLAVKQAKGDFFLFIDADLVMETDQCLEHLLLYGKIPGIGLVGARIFHAHGKILEAGAVFTGLPKHPVLHLCQEWSRKDHGYMNALDLPRNYSMVSGSFFMVRREVFDLCGGFDAEQFPDAFSDFHLCLQAVTKGFRIVSLPSLCLVMTPGGPEALNRTAEFRSSVRFFTLWKQYTDPFYNINLSLEAGQSYQEAFQKNNRPALFPLHRKRTKILSVSHELCTGGAQQVKFRIDAALNRKPDISLFVLCAALDDGILRQGYLQENIPVTLTREYWNVPSEEYHRFLDEIKRIMTTGAYDVVYANTLNCFWAVEAAYELGIPTVWSIHESYDPRRYFDMIIPDPDVREAAKSSLVHANRLVFVSRAIRDLFREYDCFGVSDCIYNGINSETVDRYLKRDKESLKSALNLPQEKKIISVIGTITERKGQLDLVDAALALLATRDDILVLIIGDFERDAGTRHYHAQIEERRGTESRIQIIANPPDVYPYFRVTDIFVCTSRIESFALVVQEAMAFCLPVITTPLPGILEQIEDGVTGLTYPPGDIPMLVTHLARLLDDRDFARVLGENAGMFVRSAFRESDMTEQYYTLIKTVALEDINCDPGTSPH
jgi:glycosyltransferase involved in cell wall biosynthesis/GT2 family glycosyltransferase